MGMDHCDDRHCLTCGDQRRDAWRKEMISWSLDCDYFHVVFTLPHEFNPLVYVNAPSMYEMLLTISKEVILLVMRDEFGCVPGMTQMLHTWGQKMNLHVHSHNIITAGGLSLDGTRWITVDPNHPKMQPEFLAALFRKMFITRVGHRLRRDKLIWPTRSLLPAADCHQALGLHSFEQLLWLCGPESPNSTVATKNEFESSQAGQPATPSKKLAMRRKRDLTAQERVFLKERKVQKWIVHCQVTPPGYVGPKRAISYLARYVAGVAISDQRLVRDADGFIVISYKDYKNRKQTGKKYGELCLSIAEFMLRFMLHILPRQMARVRHAGLFSASGREERLAKCRRLISAAKQVAVVSEAGTIEAVAVAIVAPAEQSQKVVTADQTAEAQPSSEEARIDETATAENDVVHEETSDPPKARSCECRYCKGEALEIGRLKGHEANRIILTAQMIVAEIDTHLPDVNATTVSDLLGAIRLSWLTLCLLPAAIAALLGGQTLTRLEASALEARLLHELRLTPLGTALGLIFEPAPDESMPTSGVPPPHESKVVAST